MSERVVFTEPRPVSFSTKARMIVEPSHVDRRWCIDTGDAETLAPAWIMPLLIYFAWRKIRKQRIADEQEFGTSYAAPTHRGRAP